MREKLIRLLGQCPCDGGEELGNCPYRKHGVCAEIYKIDYCAIQNLADHLIANGVTVQDWYSANDYPKEDGTYLVQTNTGTITTARFYAFKSFPATKYLPACHRSASWQSNRNVVKWTYLPQPPKGE